MSTNTVAEIIDAVVKNTNDTAVIVQQLSDNKLSNVEGLSEVTPEKLKELVDMAKIHPFYYDRVLKALTPHTMQGKLLLLFWVPLLHGVFAPEHKSRQHRSSDNALKASSFITA